MRSAHLLLLVLVCASCVDTPVDIPPPSAADTSIVSPVETPIGTPIASDEMTGEAQLTPLTGTGLKFDGAYRCTIGDLQYYMRFFERGSAVFVGGTEKYPGQLASLLTIDVKSGWNQVHNCPVQQRNDSLFIRSVGMKGVINYLGTVRASGDSVRFLRASEINGIRQIMGYAFVPDSELVPKP
jgi:hypothetical protein